tara:strand:+ start:2031 stop:3461 length:1431 start_codon:yes stop_codon:yes gene_type:complete
MVVSQIGNGDFPLNNCAILRGVLEPKQIDFIQSFLRGDALSNPIADLAGGVKSTISEAVSGLQGIGSFTENPDGTPGGFVQAPWASNLQNVVQEFQGSIVEFEQRTNRISGVVSGFQDEQPDLGRILGIGSAYNSALATLSTNPEDILKDNFSHGFNSLKQEFGVNAIQESQNVLDGIVQFAGQFGAGDTDPGDNQFFDEIIRITTTIQGIEQSFLNIANSEDAFLSGALAFLDQYGLANTALSGVLTDPCLAGKVFTDLIAGPGIEGLIPDLQLPSPPSLEQIAALIPDPEELVDDIKASVEGIVESVQQQAEQLIDSVVDQGKEAVNRLEQTFEDLQNQGQQLIDQAEQAAADLATNINEFGSNVEDFFSDEGDEEAEEEDLEAIEEDEEEISNDVDRFFESIQTPVADEARALVVIDRIRTDLESGIVGTFSNYLAGRFTIADLQNLELYLDNTTSNYVNIFSVRDALRILGQ